MEAVPLSGTSVNPQRTFLDDVLESIMTPGASPGLVAAINGSLLLLVLILVVLIVTGAADIHTGVMLFLAVGLLGSVNFFISQLRVAEDAKAQAEQQPSGSPSDGSTGEVTIDTLAGTGLAATDEAGESIKSPRSNGGPRRRRRD